MFLDRNTSLRLQQRRYTICLILFSFARSTYESLFLFVFKIDDEIKKESNNIEYDTYKIAERATS